MGERNPIKDKALRYAGQSIDEEIQRLLDDKVQSYLLYTAGFFLLMLTEWISVLLKTPRMPWWYTVVFLIAAFLAFFKIRSAKQQIKSLKLGRDGEKSVAEMLDALREKGARIFHDVQGKGFNIDHVVIAPSGIYSIETKTRTKPTPTAEVWYDGKTVLVAGQAPDRDPVQQARACAAWIAEQLEKSTGKKMPVKSVVLFPGWWVKTRKGIRPETWVLNPKALSVYIAREPSRLAAEDVSLASFHLERLIKSVP